MLINPAAISGHCVLELKALDQRREEKPHQLTESTANAVMLIFSRSVVSDSLWSHELQHASLPCPSMSPGVCPNSCPSSQWCHPTISSSVTPSPSVLKLSQHQGLFQWVSSSYQVAMTMLSSVYHLHIWGIIWKHLHEMVINMGSKGIRNERILSMLEGKQCLL